ncbi:MAG: IS30 family transposase [Endozoicomonadaceae bacterium]|nr:IS30 family transposase [Endozoicomonadaceae bacterium]
MRTRPRKEKKSSRALIANRIDITKRSMIIDEKSRIEDWVAETMIEKNHQDAIVRLVDRRTQYVFLQKVESRQENEVKDCIIKHLRKIPLKYRQTIIFDNDKAFSQHEILSKALKIKCYFSKPYASLERSLNEHTNGLSRQYLPNKTALMNIDVYYRTFHKMLR